MGDVVWNETEGQVQDRLRAQAARLEAEAAPLRAALKGRCCTVEIDGEGNATHEPNCPLSSDAGKDLVVLSVEAVEYVQNELGAALDELGVSDGNAAKHINDALDALEGVE